MLWQIFIVSIVARSFHQYQILPPIVVSDILMVRVRGNINFMKEVKKASTHASIVDNLSAV